MFKFVNEHKNVIICIGIIALFFTIISINKLSTRPKGLIDIGTHDFISKDYSVKEYLTRGRKTQTYKINMKATVDGLIYKYTIPSDYQEVERVTRHNSKHIIEKKRIFLNNDGTKCYFIGEEKDTAKSYLKDLIFNDIIWFLIEVITVLTTGGMLYHYYKKKKEEGFYNINHLSK